ncbi:MAG TPA: hypothetical protein VD884_13315 [Ohtaekwangia sp.]|nr:hypothetical protein [Ohtaekwangia sp.]
MANRKGDVGEIRIRREFSTPELHEKLDNLKRKLEYKRKRTVYQSAMIVEMLLTHPWMKSI